MSASSAEATAGQILDLVSADVILLVDGFAQLRTDFEGLEDSRLRCCSAAAASASMWSWR
jgi:hypothetical protein